MNDSALSIIAHWFARQAWQPFEFQEQVWRATLAGESGLIHAATGTGKTYAAWFAGLLDWLSSHPDPGSWEAVPPPSLQVLWITPLKALAADTEQALQRPLTDLNLPWTVARRTGDTSNYWKKKQLEQPPSALITTPESLSLLLSRRESKQMFSDLRLVVVDEWHELLGSKRGVQTELGLARLRRWRPDVRVWGLSATLGNLDEALAALLGVDENKRPLSGQLIQGVVPKEIIIDSLIPRTMDRFPWAGHLGLKMLPQVLDAIEEGKTTLLFCNTRNQVERWYQAIFEARPDWIGTVALHHGSLAADKRTWVEDGLRNGTLRCVVATSTLDLGVDFPTVDRVLQIGSPKGVARLLQRAGRSGHQPGAVSRVTCVPTHAFELVEVTAVRHAIANGSMEARAPISKPLDLLVQHVVTIAAGGGFRADELLAEVRRSYAYRHLTEAEWQWVLAFVTTGGQSLAAYDRYHRLVPRDEIYRVKDRQILNLHRSNIGTIVSDAQMQVKYLRGGSLGTLNESFVSRLKPGDKFIFAGKPLAFVRVRDMTVYVQRAANLRGATPRWTGTSLPISPELGTAVRQQLANVNHGLLDEPELQAVAPILRLQQNWSRLPDMDELLIEQIKTREGYHLFIYPFAGKLVHQGLAALLAYRLAQQQPLTFTMTVNDYGLELLSAKRPLLPSPLSALFDIETVAEELPASLNAAAMAKRQFREVARVAGLVTQGPQWQRKSARQIQASSGLIYDVLAKYESENLLLNQARQEVLQRQLDESRLMQTMTRLQTAQIVLMTPSRPTPLCFPLLVSRLQARLSSEKLADRVRRMTLQLEKWATD